MFCPVQNNEAVITEVNNLNNTQKEPPQSQILTPQPFIKTYSMIN